MKKYSNGEVIITWQSDKCQHSGNCVRGLAEVFNAKAKPWINPKGASTEAIINQIKKCPSGALGFEMEKGN